jgi:hypothetical protein
MFDFLAILLSHPLNGKSVDPSNNDFVLETDLTIPTIEL